jgi:hypothetical protein
VLHDAAIRVTTNGYTSHHNPTKGSNVAFRLDDYEPVATRLARWLETPTDGQKRVITHLVHYTDNRCVFRAELFIDQTLIATGWEEETRGEGMVNRTSHLANCETSAVGRALANAGLAGSDPAKRPSREEMSKASRVPYEEPFPDAPPHPGRSHSDPPANAATEAQLKKIRAMYAAKGITDSAAMVADAGLRIGRRLPGSSVSSLFKSEASKLIDSLMADQ